MVLASDATRIILDKNPMIKILPPIMLFLSMLVVSCSGTSTDEYLNGSFIDSLDEDTTPPNLLSPSPGERVLELQALFSWTQKYGAREYTVEIATDNQFQNQIEGSPVVIDAPQNYLVVSPTSDIKLPDGRTYFWRVRADTSESGQYGESYFDAMDDAVYVSCPKDITCSDTQCTDDFGNPITCPNVGNKSKPYRTIMRAINEAYALKIPNVKIAARGDGAPYTGSVIVKNGVSIVGGYDSNFNEVDRDSNINIAVIEGTNEAPVLMENLSRPSKIEGISIRGIDLMGSTYGIKIIKSINSIQIVDCVLQSGKSQNEISMGMYIELSSVTVDGCSITASEGVGTNGLKIMMAENIIVTNSTIVASHATGTNYDSVGMLGYDGKTITISGNYITATTSPNTIGVIFYGDNESVILSGNNINTGNTDESNYRRNYGAEIYGNSVKVVNNTITTGNANGSNGDSKALLLSGTTVEVSSNTIRPGNAQSLSGGVEISSGDMSVTNNLIITANGSSTVGLTIFNSSSISREAYISNNTIITGVASGSNYIITAHKDPGALNVTATNNIFVTIDDAGTRYGIYNYQYSPADITSLYNNIYLGEGTGVNYYAYTPAGTGDITGVNPTLDVNFRLQSTSPCSITEGGVDLSTSFITDRDSATRTTPWSMGAFEWDGPCQE